MRDHPRNATRLGWLVPYLGGALAVVLCVAWLSVDVTPAGGQQAAYTYVLPAQADISGAATLDGGQQMPASVVAPEVISVSPPPYADLGQPPASVWSFGGSASAGVGPPLVSGGDFWNWQALPDGLIYHSYLAGVRESRLASVWEYVKGYGWVWDSTLGGRVGILRYGTQNGIRPEGWQLDVEAAAFPQLDIGQDLDLIAVDFRAGVPLTYGFDRYQGKFGYYHVCSHLGDEITPLATTLHQTDYIRDAIVWGNAYYLTDDLRIYAEVSWAFHTYGEAKPWEFQIGAEYSPVSHEGDFSGSPFLAFDAEFRQDVNYEATLVLQAGWQWRSISNHLLRIGAQFYTGKNEVLQLLDSNERMVGIGTWYDY
jgi:hypothetical protein